MKCHLSTVSVLLVAVSSNLAIAQQDVPEEIRKTIQTNFIGQWEVTVTYDGETSKGRLVAKSAPGEHSVIILTELSDSQGDVHDGGVLGWESDSGVLEHRGFLSNGEHYRIRYTKTTPNKWTGYVSGVRDGQRYESQASVVWRGNSFQYKDTTLGKPFIFTGVRKKEAN